jgi:hypothetical protein
LADALLPADLLVPVDPICYVNPNSNKLSTGNLKIYLICLDEGHTSILSIHTSYLLHKPNQKINIFIYGQNVEHQIKKVL